MPAPLENHVTLSYYVNANLFCDNTSGRSVTGILHLKNQISINWFTKMQATAKTAFYVSEFVAVQTCVKQIIDLYLTLRFGSSIRTKRYMFDSNKTHVSYREAITVPAEVDYVHEKQSGGSGQYACFKVIFEPKRMEEESGMGIEFAYEVKGGNVTKEYIHGLQKGIEYFLGRGVVAGYPVIGIKATLLHGAYHDVDSSVMAFEIAGRAAAREGLRKSKASIMEPLMQVDITCPEEYLGVNRLNSY